MITSKTISQSIVGGLRRLKILVFGNSDVRESSECVPFGIDSGVPSGFKAIYAYTANRSAPVVVGYIWTNAIAAPGETRLYSTSGNDSDTAAQIELWLRTDGTMEIGGHVNHMTQYEGLATAFNQLKSDFNSLVTTFNSHTHPGVQTGPGTTAPTASSGLSSSADITPAKLTNIKTQ